MASLLAYVEADGAKPTALALEVLGEARRIASTLGGSLYAVALIADDPSPAQRDALVRMLGKHGADKVVLATIPATSGPPVWASHGDGIYEACAHVRPRLVLLPDSGGGRDIAPRLATRLGGVFIAEPSIEYGSRGELVFSRSIYGGTYRQRLIDDDMDQVVVTTLAPGRRALEQGDDDAEVILLGTHPHKSHGVAFDKSTDDPGAALESASVIVMAGAGVRTHETYELVTMLANALGGEVAATRSLCELGIAPAEREVGVGARYVSPTLYIVCGASGSSAHLGAVSGDVEIVAIDKNPDAPIFRVASYGLVGELSDLLPGLIEAVKKTGKLTPTTP